MQNIPDESVKSPITINVAKQTNYSWIDAAKEEELESSKPIPIKNKKTRK